MLSEFRDNSCRRDPLTSHVPAGHPCSASGWEKHPSTFVYLQPNVLAYAKWLQRRSPTYWTPCLPWAHRPRRLGCRSPWLFGGKPNVFNNTISYRVKVGDPWLYQQARCCLPTYRFISHSLADAPLCARTRLRKERALLAPDGLTLK